MSEIVSTAPLRRNPSIEEAPLQGDVMLFDPASAKFFVLNPTMAFLWSRCDGKATLTEIADALAEAFDGVTRETAERDLGAAAGELSSLGLLLS